MNTFQINHSFDWDRDAQVEDFLATLGNDVKVDFIDSHLANIHTPMNRAELQKAGINYGLSHFIVGQSKL